MTEGEKTTPQSRCSRDSSPDKGSLCGRLIAAPTSTHQHFKCRGGNLPPVKCIVKGERYMKATGIVRRVDDLGRIVIPKEIRRTLRIREGDPLLTTLTPIDKFCWAIHSLAQRITAQ